MKRNKIPRLWNIPLFDYHLKLNASDKDLEKIENEEISIVGYIGFLSMISLFIYYWIVDYGKPGLMDLEIDLENATRSDKIIIKWQNRLDFLPSEFHLIINFIADFLLYGCLSFMIGTAFAILLNFIFRSIFHNKI